VLPYLDIALEVKPHPYFVERQRGHNSFKVRAKSIVFSGIAYQAMKALATLKGRRASYV
jgi:hypothetical protein